MHVNVRIERRWSFDQVRRAALALAREVERRAPEQATRQVVEENGTAFFSTTTRRQRRTVASAWSVRRSPDARVSRPLTWDEVADCDPRRSRWSRHRRAMPSAATAARESTELRARSIDSRAVRRQEAAGLG